MKLKLISAGAVSVLLIPLFLYADIVALQPTTAVTASAPAPVVTPLQCYDFGRTIKKGNKSYDVRALQYALIQEGSSIPVSEYGSFGDATFAAVNAFQLKYAGEILKGGSAPTGVVGRMTRLKLNKLYGCDVVSFAPTTTATTPAISQPLKISLKVQNVSLDQNGVTVTFCNQSSGDVSVFPTRIRLNGIIRDFNAVSALKAGTCDTETLPYATWGLTYDPGSTFSVVTALDPNSMYKTSSLNFPINATTTLTVPALSGAHLSVRGIAIKSSGLQATFCNLGDQDLTSYPVRVVLNGVTKDIDIPSVYMHGKCQSIVWGYDMWGLTPTLPVGKSVTATINVDPDNIYKEVNEFDNGATITGTI